MGIDHYHGGDWQQAHMCPYSLRICVQCIKGNDHRCGGDWQQFHIRPYSPHISVRCTVGIDHHRGGDRQQSRHLRRRSIRQDASTRTARIYSRSMRCHISSQCTLFEDIL